MQSWALGPAQEHSESERHERLWEHSLTARADSQGEEAINSQHYVMSALLLPGQVDVRK